MTQETKEAPLELALVSCQTCDTAFIGSERRQTCPACGGEAAGPYFQWTLEADGLRLKDGAAPPLISREEAVRQLRALGYTEEEVERKVNEWDRAMGREPAVEAEAPPPAEGEPMVDAPAHLKAGVAGAMLAGFLVGEEGVEVDADQAKDWLLELGAEPEAAAIAVGRLTAVRELIAELTALPTAEEGEPAGPTGEGPPEDAPVSQAEVEPGRAPAEAPEAAAAVEAADPPGQGAGDKMYAEMTAAEGDDPEPAS